MGGSPDGGTSPAPSLRSSGSFYLPTETLSTFRHARNDRSKQRFRSECPAPGSMRLRPRARDFAWGHEPANIKIGRMTLTAPIPGRVITGGPARPGPGCSPRAAGAALPASTRSDTANPY